MKQIKRNVWGSLIVMLALYSLLILYFCYNLFVYSDRWFSDPNNARVKVDMVDPSIIPGKIMDRNQTVLVDTEKGIDSKGNTYYYRSYKPDARYAAHVVGSRKYGIGAEVLYIKHLLGFDNNLFERIYQKAFLDKEQGNNVILTIDIRLQKFISQAMGSRKGSIVLMNPASGEILAMISTPSYNPLTPTDEPEEESLLNKAAFGRYPPGSTMKIVTAAAALDSMEGLDSYTVECKGSTNINGIIINCYDNKAHGNVNIDKAMEVSCNAFFAKLAIDTGWKQLRNKGGKFGFNQDYVFPDIKTVQSLLPLSRDTDDEELAWSGIGQGKVLATPLQMALIAASVANKGIMPEPKLIYGIQLRSGRIKPAAAAESLSVCMTEETADRIKAMLINAVENGTGKGADTGSLSIAGKTGTAEVSTGRQPHAWFIGFAPAEKPTLAVAVILENAGTGGGQAAPLAGRILEEAVGLGY